MPGTSASALLTLAVQTAGKAGDLLAGRRGTEEPAVVGTKSSPTDVVTAMDTASERLIVDMLLGARPDDAILAEEGGRTSGASGVRWVIDPLDGTVNYLYDLPDWAVSIAAESGGEVVAGAVRIPVRGETFTALRGGGAWRDGTPIDCNAEVGLDQALVATGFGYSATRRARQGALVGELLPRVRDIRRGGSCAVDLCSVACGRVDAYYERGVQPWDTAAGALIAQEAGARVEGLHGKPAGPAFTMAAVPGLFDELHALLAPLGPELG